MSNDLTFDTKSDEWKKASSGGGGKPLSKGTHEFTVKKVELKKSNKSGKHFLKVDLELRDSKRRLFDNYLTLDSASGQFRRTTSFLESVGLSGKINIPELVETNALVGRPVKNKITSYQYTYDVDENGNGVSVSDWQDDYAELEASGRLSGPDIKVEAEAGFYQVSDFYDAWVDGQADAPASSEEVWG